MRQFIVISLALLLHPHTANADQIEPPVNPFLADSPWPMTHANPYVQGSSSLPGLTKDTAFDFDYLKCEPISITLAYGPVDQFGNRALWGNSLRRVYKVDANGRKWTYTDEHKRRQSIKNGISGAYTLVDCDGTFYIPHGETIEAFSDACPGNSLSGIRKVRELKLPTCGVPWTKNEIIVGLNMTYDGWLAIVTNMAKVVVISRDFRQVRYLCLNKNERVSNSLAIDEDGGIYVVTSTTMHRIQWDGDGLCVRWSVPYKTSGVHYTGRLGAGSGTTPTLMGVGDQDKFVVIGDGRRVMHLLLIWRDEIPADWAGIDGYDRRVAAELPMQFGQSNSAKSSTEQSILVSGYGAFVVSNLYGQRRPNAQYRGPVNKFRIIFSNREGIVPSGIEKFIWNPVSRQLERSWANRCICCPNGIPTMSRATQLIYFVGARNEVWNLEAVDWNSGDNVFHIPLGREVKYNSYYAATEIGPNGEIVSGALTGLMRLSNQPSR